MCNLMRYAKKLERKLTKILVVPDKDKYVRIDDINTSLEDDDAFVVIKGQYGWNFGHDENPEFETYNFELVLPDGLKTKMEFIKGMLYQINLVNEGISD